MSRRFPILAFSCSVGVLTLSLVGCGIKPAPMTAVAPTAAEKPEEHVHKPGSHGGLIIEIGRDSYHAEVVFETGGIVRLYMLGKDEARVQEVETQELVAYVKPSASTEATEGKFLADPQTGDAAGKTSRFTLKLPAALHGKTVQITIPILRINGERFRIAFSNEKAGHDDNAMPSKLNMDEEQKVFFTPGGIYTEADIQANGRTVPSSKFKGIRANHNAEPKPGDKICPISETLANPKFTWVIGGKTYEFCCTPCVEEFVVKAKEKPAEVKPPEAYIRK